MGIDVSFNLTPRHPRNKEYGLTPSMFPLENIYSYKGDSWIKEYLNRCYKTMNPEDKDANGVYLRFSIEEVFILRENYLIKEEYPSEYDCLMEGLGQLIGTYYSRPDDLYDIYIEADW